MWSILLLPHLPLSYRDCEEDVDCYKKSLILCTVHGLSFQVR